MEENFYSIHAGTVLTNTVIESFEPIVDSECTKLILGTMPGFTSSDKKEYYGHVDNTFWDIIVRVLDTEHKSDTVEEISYAAKKTLLLKNKIALWDVLKYCNRKGNLDSAIKNAVKNNFEEFFSNYPKIKTIIFNGQNARKYFDSCFKDLPQHYNLTLTEPLPSTSPSHALNAFVKLRHWRQALNPYQT